ncbi:MAG: extracellular solute-binding protein [Planctomycetia bacterium]|nr:extracellular solute-binding protein [Planctomycetia bacterium]
MPTQSRGHGTRTSLGSRKSLALALGLLLPLLLTGCARPQPRVVAYCAQDKEFAEGVFADFTLTTGLPVAPHYDTEATKSVSLYEELVREASRPRCDVFWNNEILSTIRLQRQGLLEPYDSPSAADYPDWARAKDRTWTAFAARARVLIVNTDLVPAAERPKSLFDLTEPRWQGKVALAKPQFGTTATHAACLFEVLGPEKARGWFLGLRGNEVKVVDGNKAVAVGVGAGQYAIGLTDTDDAITEVEAGRPVAIIFPDRDRPADDRMGTLFIPNTVMLIKGAPNPDGGKRLIDFLLSARVERQLAETASHQIPLNPKVEAKLPAAIETPRTVKPMRVDWEKAADRWKDAQKFLADEFARP